MATKRSAGILLFRRDEAGPQVLLVHPGGPYWAKRDHGAWSIPKGEIEDGEEPRACALRELAEELVGYGEAVLVLAPEDLRRAVVHVLATAATLDEVRDGSGGAPLEGTAHG